MVSYVVRIGMTYKLYGTLYKSRVWTVLIIESKVSIIQVEPISDLSDHNSAIVSSLKKCAMSVFRGFYYTHGFV